MADTIVALSSGALPAAIGVMRLSGPDAITVATSLAGRLPPPREARVRALQYQGDLLDRALVLVFPAQESVTGEDLVEFHLHGGRAVAHAVEAALLSHPCVRRAEPGEFTRRALTNGRIDLIEAEALGELLAAETDAQRQMAIRSGSGALRQAIDAIQVELLQASAKIELTLDFADDEDAAAEDALLASARETLVSLVDRIEAWTSMPTTDRLRDGYRVVLAGPPNAGKSTLLNCLAGREAAIVSDIAGTTRDRIEVPVAHGGLPFLLIDTAGLADSTDDPIERIGMDRTRQAVEQADVVLWMGDAPSPYDQAILLHAKADIPDRAAPYPHRISISAKNFTGVDVLWAAIRENVADRLPPADGLTMNQRQKSLLVDCAHHARMAMATDDPLLIAQSLRAARSALDRITGASGTEAMLTTLFSGFCIGK